MPSMRDGRSDVVMGSMDFHPAFQNRHDADGGLERAEVGFGKLLLRLFPQGDEGGVVEFTLPLGVRRGWAARRRLKRSDPDRLMRRLVYLMIE
jgi:hypothetical protein